MTDRDSPTEQFPPEYDTLRTIEVFTGDRIGAGGLTPPHLTAWRRLLTHEKANEYFKQLAARGTLAGQLYGLAGLYFTDRAWFVAEVQRYKALQGTVRTIFACFVGDTPARELVEQIENGSLPHMLRGSAEMT